MEDVIQMLDVSILSGPTIAPVKQGTKSCQIYNDDYNDHRVTWYMFYFPKFKIYFWSMRTMLKGVIHWEINQYKLLLSLAVPTGTKIIVFSKLSTFKYRGWSLSPLHRVGAINVIGDKNMARFWEVTRKFIDQIYNAKDQPLINRFPPFTTGSQETVERVSTQMNVSWG